MSFDDISEMIKRILEQDDVPREFCELVYQKTGGNPFFVEEVIKSLKEEEVIYREENRWKIREVSRIEFPKTVRSVIKRRISRLDDESQNVLTMASFIGKDFTFEALQAVTGVEEDKLLEIMEKMFKTGLIKQKVIHGKALCSFVDIIVRDVVHEEVSPLRRKKLHGDVGNALEEAYAKEIDEHLGELALHFLECGDENRALDYFLKAGEKAAKVYANSEAASYFQSALKLLEQKEGELHERGHVLEKLGDIKNIVGENDACMKHWNDALLLWRQLHDKEKVSRLHRKMANALWEDIGDTEKAKEHHGKALKILEAEPESTELASLYEDVAHMHYRIGDMAKALSWAEKALELAKKLNAFEVVASSYTSLGTIFSFKGDKKKAFECLEKALKIALDNGYMETALRACTNLPTALTAEENERRLEYYEKGLELAEKVGYIGLQSFIGTNLAWAYIGMGNTKKALLLLEESVTLDRKTHNMPNLSFSIGILGFAYQVLGEWDKSEQYYKEMLSISKRLDEFQQIAGSYALFAWLHFDKEEYVKAREYAEKAYEVYEKAGAKYVQMDSSRFLIRTYIELGEIEKAKSLIDKLHKFSLKIEDKEFMATTDALKAMLFHAQKKWKESIEHFEKALQQYEALESRRWDTYSFAKNFLYEYARVYLERNQDGDEEKAYDLLNQALEIFQKLGAKKDIEKIESKLAHIETARRMLKPEPVTEVVLPEHIATGFADLDDLLFGGMPRNYAVILTSPSCNERDMLVNRFLETGAKEGQVTFHVVSRASETRILAEEFQTNFYLFVCNPQADKIIRSLPNVSKLKGVENLNDINIALSSAFRRLDQKQKGPRRACIEIISDILLQHHTVQTRRWLNALIPELKSKGFTTLAVMDRDMHSPQEVRAILDLFEGEINIFEKETEKGSKKFLRIEKMLNQKYLENEVPLRKKNT